MRLLTDLRLAARSLRRAPVFTAVAMATLALGIGANTAIFGVVNAVLFQPLPYKDAGSLVVVNEYLPRENRTDEAAAADYLDWRADAQTFDGLAAWISWGVALTGQGEPEDLTVVRASPNLFDVLSLRLELGRGFLPEEETFGRHRVVVLTHGFWARKLGSDSTVLGRTLILDDEPYQVVGVMAPGPGFPADHQVDLYLPLGFSEGERADRPRRMFSVIGRLAPGATLSLASKELENTAARLGREFPASNEGWTVRIRDAQEALVGDQQHLILLMAAVGLLLLIACANVANLLLTRGTSRRRELAIRAALGAGRGRLAGQVMMESLILACLGGVAGVGLGSAGLKLVLAVQPGVLPGWNQPKLDGAVLAAAIGFAVVSAVIAGLAPARQALGWKLTDALREGLTGSRRSVRVRAALMVAEVGLAFVLVTSAGLLIHSLRRLLSVDSGFQAAGLLTTTLSLPEARYPGDAKQHQFFRDVLSRVEAIPGVTSAAMTTTLPLHPVGIDHDIPVIRPEHPVPPGAPAPQADFRMVSAGYFEVLGVPLRRGRFLTEADREGAPKVVVVNETFVRQFFGADDPINSRIQVGGPDWVAEIVGVVGDVRHRGLDQDQRPEIFVPFPQWYSYANMTLVIRTQAPTVTMVPEVKAVVSRLDPNQPLGRFATMAELISASTGERRFNLVLFGCFAVLGLALAITGIYGVVSFSVGQRTREIGIRLALGATRSEIVRGVLQDGLRLTGLGIAIGLVGAVAAGLALRGMLFGVSAMDPLALLTAGFALGFAAILASLVPAARAARLDPVVALRSE